MSSRACIVLALLKWIPTHRAVAFESAKLAAFEISTVGEHHVYGHERAGVIVREERERSTSLDGVVFDAAWDDGRDSARQQLPVIRIDTCGRLNQPRSQLGHDLGKEAIRRKIRSLPLALAVCSRLVAGCAACTAETRLEFRVQFMNFMNFAS